MAEEDTVCVKTLSSGKNNTSVADMDGSVMDLVSECGVYEYDYPKKKCFVVTDLMEKIDRLLEQRGVGYKVDFGQRMINCPALVISERSTRTTLKYSLCDVDITLGNDNARPKLMHQGKRKELVLKLLQGKNSVDNIDRREYEGLLTKIKDRECIVIIPGQLTRMNPGELTGEEKERHDRKARYFFSKVLATLADNVVCDDEDGSPFAVHQKIVIGNSGKITQSQIAISKMLWKTMFDGHEIMMQEDLLQDVFRVRPKKRASSSSSYERSFTCGKSLAVRQSLGKKLRSTSGKKLIAFPHHENNEPNVTTYDTIKDTIKMKTYDLTPEMVCHLISMLTKLRDHLPEEDFENILETIKQYGENPEDALIEYGTVWLEEYGLSNGESVHTRMLA